MTDNTGIVYGQVWVRTEPQGDWYDRLLVVGAHALPQSQYEAVLEPIGEPPADRPKSVETLMDGREIPKAEEAPPKFTAEADSLLGAGYELSDEVRPLPGGPRPLTPTEKWETALEEMTPITATTPGVKVDA